MIQRFLFALFLILTACAMTSCAATQDSTAATNRPTADSISPEQAQNRSMSQVPVGAASSPGYTGGPAGRH